MSLEKTKELIRKEDERTAKIFYRLEKLRLEWRLQLNKEEVEELSRELAKY